MVGCPWFFTSHGCMLISGHQGDHLCLGAPEVAQDWWDGGWCTWYGAGGAQWADWLEVCAREVAGSDRLFT